MGENSNEDLVAAYSFLSQKPYFHLVGLTKIQVLVFRFTSYYAIADGLSAAQPARSTVCYRNRFQCFDTTLTCAKLAIQQYLLSSALL